MRSANPLLLCAVTLAIAACERDDADTSPPEVVGVSPPEGSAGAGVQAPVTATFSEAIDPETIGPGALLVSSAGAAVPGGVSLSEDGLTVTFVVDSALHGFTPYTAGLSADIADLAGNALETPFSWSFVSSAGLFVLRSAEIPEGAAFPATSTCESATDDRNDSPVLEWSEGPPGTASYALALTDLNSTLLHWVLWDVPPSVRELAAAVPTVDLPDPPAGGAKQALSYDGATWGYLGPCPGGAAHTYELAVFALDVAELPGVTTASTRIEVAAVIHAHALASATLHGTSSASP